VILEAFYEHVGFNVIGRSPLNGQSKPFPLLHIGARQGSCHLSHNSSRLFQAVSRAGLVLFFRIQPNDFYRVPIANFF